MKKSRKERRARRQVNTQKAGAVGIEGVEGAVEEVESAGKPQLICAAHSDDVPATTLLCQHLAADGAEGIGFYTAASGALRPAASCGACAAVWEANNNQFNDAVKAALDPQARCDSCYDAIAKANVQPPVATEL